MGHAEVQTVVNESSHSLFLTSLLVNEAFYQSLSEEHQQVLHAASLEVARAERAKSIADANKAREEFLAGGGRLVRMSDAEIDRLRALAAPIWQQFEPMFGADLIRAIRNFEQLAVA